MIKLRRGLVDALFSHAAGEYPREACGVIVGPPDGDSSSHHLVPMRNTADTDSEFAFDPDEQMAVWQGAEDAGHVVRVIYHSHPRSRPRPSRVDLAAASYSDIVYLIIGQGEQLGAFQIKDGYSLEIPIRIS